MYHWNLNGKFHAMVSKNNKSLKRFKWLITTYVQVKPTQYLFKNFSRSFMHNRKKTTIYKHLMLHFFRRKKSLLLTWVTTCFMNSRCFLSNSTSSPVIRSARITRFSFNIVNSMCTTIYIWKFSSLRLKSVCPLLRWSFSVLRWRFFSCSFSRRILRLLMQRNATSSVSTSQQPWRNTTLL